MPATMTKKWSDRSRSPHHGNGSGCLRIDKDVDSSGQNILSAWPVEQIEEAEKPGRPAHGVAMLVKPMIRFQLIN